jgi:chemotaxis protein MotB
VSFFLFEVAAPGAARKKFILKGIILMVKRIIALFCLLPLLGMVGCVGQSAYEKKAEEATSISRDLAEAQHRNSALVRDNESLRADIAGLRVKVDELETARKRLEQTMVSGDQTPYQFVAELEREKGRLREDLAKILRTQDDRVRTSSRTYESFLEIMKDEIAQGQIRISELRGTIRLEFLEEAIFDGTKTDVSPRGITLLRKVAGLMKDRKDIDVSVDSGYEIPLNALDASARQQTPWRVPLLRSLSVARLIQQSGVASATLRANTRGEFGQATNTQMMTDSSTTNGIDILITVKE